MPTVPRYPPGAPSWVDLASTDPAGARKFYGTLFGWTFDIGPAETGHYTMCLLDGDIVAGMNGEPVASMPTVWMTYLSTENADEAAKRVTAAGGAVVMGPLDVLEHGRLVVGTDPGGAMFGVWQPRRHIGASRVNEPGTLCWTELVTRDLEPAKRFYTSVCGYAWEPVDTGEDGPRYETFAVDGRVVGGAIQMTSDWPADVPSHWMPYFGVGDTDAAVATTERLGGEVRLPPTDSPFGRFAVLADPQGGVFTVTTLVGDTPPSAGV